MSEIITSLPVNVTTNNDMKIGTRDRDIISASIKAPDINRNLLTQEYVMNNIYSYGLNNGVFQKKDGYFHYDMSKLNSTSDGGFFYLPLYLFNLKPNTKYTFVLQFFNVINGRGGLHFGLRLDFDTGRDGEINMYLSPTKDTIYTKTFSFPSNVQVMGLYYNSWWWEYGWNGSFDLRIISLVEGDTPLLTETPSLGSYSKQSIITSNECNSLGSYSLSPYIRKHIQTVEHNIVKQENLYDITWR